MTWYQTKLFHMFKSWNERTSIMAFMKGLSSHDCQCLFTLCSSSSQFLKVWNLAWDWCLNTESVKGWKGFKILLWLDLYRRVYAAKTLLPDSVAENLPMKVIVLGKFCSCKNESRLLNWSATKRIWKHLIASYIRTYNLKIKYRN